MERRKTPYPESLSSQSDTTIVDSSPCSTCHIPAIPPLGYVRTPGFTPEELFQRKATIEQALAEEKHAIRSFYRGFIKDHLKKHPDMRLRLSTKALDENVDRAMMMGEWLIKSKIVPQLAWNLSNLVMYDFCVLLGLSMPLPPSDPFLMLRL